MQSVETRAARPGDAAAVAAYHDRCVRSTFAAQLAAGATTAPDVRDTHRQLHERFVPGSGFATQVAVIDDQPIGHVSVCQHHLVHLFVAPDHQGRGIGRHLLEQGEAMIAGMGHRDFELHVRVDNPAAVAFYERAGWDLCGRVIHTIEHGIGYDEHVLVKANRPASWAAPRRQPSTPDETSLPAGFDRRRLRRPNRTDAPEPWES